MTSDQKSRISYNNFKYFGYDLNEVSIKAAKEYVNRIIVKFNEANKFVILCGIEGNGLDGLYIGEELSSKGKVVEIYIPGRVIQSNSDTFKEKYSELSKNKDLKLFQDIYAKDIPQGDVIIEALSGTGFEGDSLSKRSADVIKRVAHFSLPIVTVDKAIPGYKPSLTISLNYPKSKEAEVIENIYPESLNNVVGPGELLEIKKPYLKSHKTKSGKLLLVSFSADSETLKKVNDITQSYPAEVEVLSIQNLFNEYESDSYKEKIKGSDAILIDIFEEGDELISMVINKILESAEDSVVINLSNNLRLNHVNFEAVLSPNELSNSNAMIKVVKGFNSSIIFNDGQKKIDKSGMLSAKESIQDLLILSSIFATANDISISVIAAAFTVIHFNQNKLEIEKDLTKFFEDIF